MMITKEIQMRETLSRGDYEEGHAKVMEEQ